MMLQLAKGKPLSHISLTHQISSLNRLKLKETFTFFKRVQHSDRDYYGREACSVTMKDIGIG